MTTHATAACARNLNTRVLSCHTVTQPTGDRWYQRILWIGFQQYACAWIHTRSITKKPVIWHMFKTALHNLGLAYGDITICPLGSSCLHPSMFLVVQCHSVNMPMPSPDTMWFDEHPLCYECLHAVEILIGAQLIFFKSFQTSMFDYHI